MAQRHGPFDVVFAPINGAVVDFPHLQPPSPLAAAMEPEQAAVAAASLGAGTLIPMHYGGFEIDPVVPATRWPRRAIRGRHGRLLLRHARAESRRQLRVGGGSIPSNLLASPHLPLRIGWFPRGMAEHSSRTVVAIAALALAGTVTPGGPPPLPVLPPERVRAVRGRVLGPAAVSVPVRALVRWLRLCLALPAIGTTPPSRSDTPALPTIGRPRDGPRPARDL